MEKQQDKNDKAKGAIENLTSLLETLEQRIRIEFVRNGNSYKVEFPVVRLSKISDGIFCFVDVEFEDGKKSVELRLFKGSFIFAVLGQHNKIEARFEKDFAKSQRKTTRGFYVKKLKLVPAAA